jgi:hypothetical protein
MKQFQPELSLQNLKVKLATGGDTFTKKFNKIIESSTALGLADIRKIGD